MSPARDNNILADDDMTDTKNNNERFDGKGQTNEMLCVLIYFQEVVTLTCVSVDKRSSTTVLQTVLVKSLEALYESRLLRT